MGAAGGLRPGRGRDLCARVQHGGVLVDRANGAALLARGTNLLTAEQARAMLNVCSWRPAEPMTREFCAAYPEPRPGSSTRWRAGSTARQPREAERKLTGQSCGATSKRTSPSRPSGSGSAHCWRLVPKAHKRAPPICRGASNQYGTTAEASTAMTCVWRPME